MPTDGAPYRPWRTRIGWLVVLWLAGVGTLGIVALTLKSLMRLAGLTA